MCTRLTADFPTSSTCSFSKIIVSMAQGSHVLLPIQLGNLSFLRTGMKFMATVNRIAHYPNSLLFKCDSEPSSKHCAVDISREHVGNVARVLCIRRTLPFTTGDCLAAAVEAIQTALARLPAHPTTTQCRQTSSQTATVLLLLLLWRRRRTLLIVHLPK